MKLLSQLLFMGGLVVGGMGVVVAQSDHWVIGTFLTSLAVFMGNLSGQIVQQMGE